MCVCEGGGGEVRVCVCVGGGGGGGGKSRFSHFLLLLIIFDTSYIMLKGSSDIKSASYFFLLTGLKECNRDHHHPRNPHVLLYMK